MTNPGPNPYRPPVPASDEPHPEPTAAQTPPGFVPGGWLSKGAILLFWSCAALAGCTVTAVVLVLIASGSAAVSSWMPAVVGALGYCARALPTVQIVAGLAFLLWFHRVYSNVLAFGVVGLKYSPAWAIGGFFIPLVQLVLPYRVGREIWVASGPGVLKVVGPRAAAASSGPVGLWWGLCLATIVTSPFARFAGEGTAALLTVGVQQLLYFSAALATVHLIRRLNLRQAERALAGAPAAGQLDAAAPVEEIHRCPSCSVVYDPADYRDDLPHIFCSSCKAELPRAPSTR